jgi:hypothetical protein
MTAKPLFRNRSFGSVESQSLGKPAARFPAAIATDSDLAIAVDRQQTALAQTLDSVSTSMTVSAPSSITAYNLLSIDSEIVKVTGPPAGGVVPIQRGFDGTTPATHLSGAPVSGFIDAWHHNALIAEIEAIEQTLGANLSKIPASPFYLAAVHAFTPQSPGGSLTVGTNSIVLSPVPAGVNGSDTGHYLYIDQGTGTPEPVPITGGNAVAGASSGTIFVTCANPHSGAWRIYSATSGIQEAVNAAGAAGGGIIYIGPGTHNMYGTVNVNGHGIHIFGCGGVDSALTGTILQRTTDYGDTFHVGGVYDFAVQDMQFLHVINYAPGPPPTMINPITVHTNSAHLSITGAQGSRIEHCGFSNMPNNLLLNGGAHFTVRHNYFVGLWDPKNTNCQVTVANISLQYYSGGGQPTDCEFKDNYIWGYLSAARTRTIASVTVPNVQENVGPQYGILAANFENIQISGGIIGAMSGNGIGFVNSTGQAALGCEISNLQFDSEGAAEIFFQASSGTISNIVISNCTFNGEITTGFNGIYAPNAASNYLFGLSITGCVFLAYAAAPILLGAVCGVAITGNTFRGYNSCQAYNSDQLNGSAIGIYGTSNNVSITGNTVGGDNAGNPVGSGAYTNFGIAIVTSGPVNFNVAGNTVVSLADGLDLAYLTARDPLTFGATYYIASETGTNNAIVGQLNANIPQSAGLTLRIALGHSLQAGANTLNFNSKGAVAIRSSRNTANNIATAYAAGGLITLMYNGTVWVDISQ